MHKQETDEFFGIVSARGNPENSDVDALFIKLMSGWRENQGSIAIYLMRRYKKRYSASFRERILRYVALLLLNPEMARQKDKIVLAGPTVIIPHFYEVRHVLEGLDALDEHEEIYAPILYKLGIKAAGGDYQQYFSMLREIVLLPNAYKVFVRDYAWGLEPCTHNCYVSFSYTDGDAPSAGNARSAIVDAFLEPFMYGKDDEGCPVLLNKESYQLRELSFTLSKSMLDYQYDLYKLLLGLVKKSTLVKENFIRWLRTVYLRNRERRKMMFDKKKCMSDGYAFNLNGVLTNFNMRIIEKGMNGFDMGWFVDEKTIDLRGEDKAETRDSEARGQGFSFQTAVFFSKVFMGCLSFIKVLEMRSEYEMRMSYFEGGMQRQIVLVQSMLNAYRIILYSDMSVAEMMFLRYMSKYALSNPVPEIFLSFYLNMSEFLVHDFDFNPDADLCTRILESDFSLHAKVPVVKIVFYSRVKVGGELLVKLYTEIERLEEGERRGVRYYLNRILANYDVRDVKFINCVMKDMESLLSSGLGALMELKKKYSSKASQQAKSSFFCLAELFRLLRRMIEQSPTLFLGKEILPQFVSILNYNLKIIVGPRCSELKCSDKSKNLGFEPKEFLRTMLMFYMEMHKHSDAFLLTVVKDTMYFNLSLFKRALRICETKQILCESELEEMGSMVRKAETLVSENVEEDLVVPEQFIDPVTCMPMRDPVRLKTSNATIDKSTFDMLLINSGIDPFNREVLAEDGYVVDEVLKKEIDEYWAGRNC